MSPESPNPDRLLLFGEDANLLEIRAMVLRSAGMTVDIAADINDLKVRIAASGQIYHALICCHTVTEAECAEVIAIANRTQTALIMLECLLPPSELIDRVSELIGERPSRSDGATSGPSQ
jgi:hypothetical protein